MDISIRVFINPSDVFSELTYKMHAKMLAISLFDRGSPVTSFVESTAALQKKIIISRVGRSDPIYPIGSDFVSVHLL